jgi:hypothetical protein
LTSTVNLSICNDNSFILASSCLLYFSNAK